ncbi:RNA polymerase sporulation sigma factor SigK [Alicyclobacillus sp. SO9]|uniref:RNA polymerase sporulation sigma factor SigK n=1 Tax=Alicyclobacillus sp. SO9 TaxID=2665646 RepID=UPI0018E80C9B|nr:RNA polymerase sporulation sigma factor SigK [Alicyclobacillus sp. SO9]QQE81341.1 RNA polymerase sporulation sigma factor SigK [Alicyclobacillus sp. SO9]
MTGLFAVLTMILKDISLFVSYVKHNAFPQPLSGKEEAKLVERMQQGDETARNNLIEHNLRLVAHLAKKFDTTGEDSEDLISIGTIGLIKAVERYTPDRGTKLATFAARCIDNEILMYLRSNKKRKKDVSLEDPIGADKEGNEMTLSDLLGSDPDDVVDTVDLSWEKQKMYEILPMLATREREVLCKRYGLPNGREYTQREIAKELGISRSYVSRIERKALDKLNTHMKTGSRIG